VRFVFGCQLGQLDALRRYARDQHERHPRHAGGLRPDQHTAPIDRRRAGDVRLLTLSDGRIRSTDSRRRVIPFPAASAA
jgi:hypothetical protein